MMSTNLSDVAILKMKISDYHEENSAENNSDEEYFDEKY